MIIVKLMGGLGNQMFQYAAARSLSLRHDTELKLDVSFLEGDQVGYNYRMFDLDHFAINAEKASHFEICSMRGTEGTGLVPFAARTIKRVLGKSVYHEKWFHFDPRMLALPDNVYLNGYWQSERYFSNCRDMILKEFTVTAALSGEYKAVYDEIQLVNSVSLHVRRGDYVKDERIHAVHGVCDLAYYQRAENRVAKIINNPHFFVFSDDPDWVADHVKLHHPARYVSHNDSMAHEDLRLMSNCKHHVIANSSFSWWAAWLSESPDKLVIAPDRWFRNPSIHTGDLIPPDWQRL